MSGTPSARGRAADSAATGPVRGFFRGSIDKVAPLEFPEPARFEEETLVLFLDSLRRFAAGAIDSARIDEESAVGDPVIAGLREIGLFGLAIPEAYGGFGFDAVRTCRVMEELGSIDVAVSTLMGGHSSIGAKGLLLFGTEEQKARFLPDLASGESIACFALSEPNAGSDVHGMKTRADRNEDGRLWTLNGTKFWITNGGVARFFTVFARTPMAAGRENDITAFVLSREEPGLSIGREESKLGIRGSSTVEVVLENVRVPDDQVLGPPGRGFAIAMEILNHGRLGLSAGCVGQAKKIRAAAAAYARERRQFSRPIASFELVKEKLADMALDVYAMESLVYSTAALVDRGAKDFSLEAAVAKVFCSEALWRVVNHALQIAGGNGFIREYPYERFLRDARVNLIFEGTNEVLRHFIAMAGLKGPRREVDAMRAKLGNPLTALPEVLSFFGKQTARAFARDSAPEVEPELRREATSLEQAVKWLGQASVRALVKHGDSIAERQLVQQRLADAAIDAAVMAAVLHRAGATLASAAASEEERKGALARARLVHARAIERVKRNLDAIDDNEDGLVVEIADERES